MTTTRNRQPAGRGLCADCGTDSALTAAGDVIVHGPRDLRCTGSGRPPKPPAPPLFVPAVGVTADTAAEPSAAVESASAPVRYREGDRVRSGGLLGTVEAVYGSTVEVAWDDGRVQTVDAETIERVERPEDEPAVEVAPLPPVTQPVYTLLDEDDGAIDGGAVTPRAQTSHADIPAEVPEPSLLGMAMRSRIEQLEAEAAARSPDCEAQRRRIAVLEVQLDASREEVAALTRRLADTAAERDGQRDGQRRQIEVIAALRLEVGTLTTKNEALSRKLAAEEALCDKLSREGSAAADDARRSRDTLRGALDLIGRLGPA